MNNMISLCGHLTELANRTSPFLLQGKQSPFMGASSINIVSHAILPRKRCGYPCCPRCIQIIIWLSTLWEFNIAMEKHNFHWENSVKMAMFNSYVDLPVGKWVKAFSGMEGPACHPTLEKDRLRRCESIRLNA